MQANYMTKVIDILTDAKLDKKSALTKVRQLIVDSKIRDFSALYTFLYAEIDNYAQGHIGNVILILAEGDVNDTFATDKELHIVDTLLKIIGEIK